MPPLTWDEAETHATELIGAGIVDLHAAGLVPLYRHEVAELWTERQALAHDLRLARARLAQFHAELDRLQLPAEREGLPLTPLARLELLPLRLSLLRDPPRRSRAHPAAGRRR